MRKVAHRAAPLTAKDIALELGLSQPTVSRILAGAVGYRVAPETRKRVLDTAARMGYQPNAIARSLRQRRTNVVGFYTGHDYLDARNPFLASLIGGLQRAGDSFRLDLLLHGVFRGGSSEDIFGELTDGRVDGLIVNTVESDPLVTRLKDAALPVVAVTDAIPGIPSVVCDDADGIRQLIDYLWAQGHRRIAFLRPRKRYYSVEVRCEAFIEEMCRRGANRSDFPMISIEMENAGEALPTLRNLPNPPTAVCCWNDMAAYDLLYACRLAGVSIPHDLAVVGFDGFLNPKLMAWSLVTISASWDAVAEQAMHSLVQLIGEGNNMNSGNENAVRREEVPLISRLPVTLVPGMTA
jgi:DNA-binding LacI/PurR family transcriptional regulator